jgi:hypothetical protein
VLHNFEGDWPVHKIAVQYLQNVRKRAAKRAAEQAASTVNDEDGSEDLLEGSGNEDDSSSEDEGSSEDESESENEPENQGQLAQDTDGDDGEDEE